MHFCPHCFVQIVLPLAAFVLASCSFLFDTIRFHGKRKKRSLRMRCVLFTGTLGSGKTTLITAVLSENAKAGFPKPVLIVNDVGRFNVDRSRLAGAGTAENILDLTSGCLDCADRDAFVRAVLDTVAQGKDLMVEPTGAANGDNLKGVFDECGLRPLTVALLSAAHFRRNRAYDPKAMESQIRHADLIGLTWWEGLGVSDLTDPALEEVLRYVGHHAPSARVFLVPKEGVPAELLDAVLHSRAEKGKEHVCGHGCGHSHGHDHAHHGHLHAHVRTCGLSAQVGMEALRDLCLALQRSHGLVRAKGAVGGSRFDFVHGDFRTQETDSPDSSANFISSSPIPEALLLECVGDEVRDDGVTLEDAVQAIRYGLDHAWEPLMENGDVREDNAFLYRAYHRSIEFPVPEDLRRQAILAYADWYLRVIESLRSRDWDGHPKLPQWKRRIGVHLTLLAARHGEVLGMDRVQQIAALRPAHLAFEGLLEFRPEDLSFKADPVETPDDLLQVGSFGILHESFASERIEEAFRHCRSLSDDPSWTQKWSEASVS